MCNNRQVGTLYFDMSAFHALFCAAQMTPVVSMAKRRVEFRMDPKTLHSHLRETMATTTSKFIVANLN